MNIQTASFSPLGTCVYFQRSNSENRKYKPIIDALPSIKSKGECWSSAKWTKHTLRWSSADNPSVMPLFLGSDSSPQSISLAQLIPPEKNLTNYYRYKGSLTTPGCTESVIWTLFEDPIPLSIEQVRTQCTVDLLICFVRFVLDKEEHNFLLLFFRFP